MHREHVYFFWGVLCKNLERHVTDLSLMYNVCRVHIYCYKLALTIKKTNNKSISGSTMMHLWVKKIKKTLICFAGCLLETTVTILEVGSLWLYLSLACSNPAGRLISWARSGLLHQEENSEKHTGATGRQPFGPTRLFSGFAMKESERWGLAECVDSP